MIFQFNHNIYKNITIDTSKRVPVCETFNGNNDDNRLSLIQAVLFYQSESFWIDSFPNLACPWVTNIEEWKVIETFNKLEAKYGITYDEDFDSEKVIVPRDITRFLIETLNVH